MRASHLALLLVLPLCGCADLRGSEGSKVSTAQTFASAYWFRGTPRSLQPVTQGDLEVATPLANGGTVSFVTWYNLQLTNETGDGEFPRGNGGQDTEVDLQLSYVQTFGRVRLTGGGIAYHFPQVGPSTREGYVSAATRFFGLAHAFSVYYDVDLLDDYYLLYQVSHDFVLDDTWSAGLALFLGYMSDGQAAFYFGREHAGLSDLLLTGTLTYAYDRNTSLFFRAAGVTVPDDELAASLDDDGFENSGLWCSIGAAWGL